MLDDDTPLCDLVIVVALVCREFTTLRLPDRTGMLDIGEFVPKKPQIIEQLACVREWIRRRIGNRLIMSASFIGVAHKQHQEGVNQQHVLHGVSLFLAAITAPLFIRVFGANNGAFGTVVDKKGVDASTVTCARRS